MDKFGVQKESLKRIAKQPVIPIVETIIKSESETHNFYGGQIKNIETDGEVSATGMHDKTGVLIVEVPVFGVVANYDLRKGDVILKVNNEIIDNVTSLQKKLKTIENKGKIKSITVWRDQKRIILKMNK